MLTEITLKNFKCFKEKTVFPLGKFNLLTGINGRGKSSLLQSLLLFKQTVEHNPNTNALLLNGSCVELGTFEEVKNSDNPNEMPIEIGFSAEKEGYLSIHLEMYNNDTNSRIIIPRTLKVTSNIGLSLKGLNELVYDSLWNKSYYNGWVYKENDLTELISAPLNFFPEKPFFAPNYIGYHPLKIPSFRLTDFCPIHKIHYIAADRIGPKNNYKQENLGDFITTGTKGENTATVLIQMGESLVNDKLYLGNSAKTLLEQCEEWLNYIFEGAKVSIKTERDMIYISYNTNQKSHRYRPSNVGFGYSYILPIVVSGLIAKEGEILIVENPEAHLHPKAQSRLTEFLARVAACKVQVFVETHSEHILNALRIATLKEDIDIQHDEVSILYFQDNEEVPFVPIPVDKNGGIDTWPEGFFDQNDKDFKILFGF